MKITLRLALACTAILFAFVIAGVHPAAGSAETYRISGVVINSITGQPVAQVHLVASGAAGGSGERETYSGADGKFTIENVPAGVWNLAAERKGFVSKSYEQKNVFNSGASSVITGPDGVSEGLVFRLDRTAAISGKVTDENGDPLPGTIVHLLVQVSSGHKQVMLRKVVAADDLGEYRMWDLPPVTCYLAVLVPAAPPEESGPDSTGFALQYYPNTSDPHRAAPIELKPAGEVTANFVMHPARGVSVVMEGKSGVPGGEESEVMILMREGPQGSSMSSSTLGPGRGRIFDHIAPGRYKLIVCDLSSTYVTSRWIDVGSEDLTVNLPFPNPPDVAAHVSLVDGDPALLHSATLGIDMRSAPSTTARPLNPDGTANFPAQASGRYEVVLNSNQQLYIKSISAQNARVADGQVELPEAGPVKLEIVASGDGARVKGKVRTAGKPVSGVEVILVPRKESGNPEDCHGYQSDSDGSFDFTGIKPGDYLLFATKEWPIEYADRAAIQSYLPLAKTVKAMPKGTVDIQLELVHP